MDDLRHQKPERRPIKELNLVPVIDMFTTVIFFLVLSTSFYAFTKVTLPPSKVSVNTDPLRPPPLGTKLLLERRGSMVRALLAWTGDSPGRDEALIPETELMSAVSRLGAKFKQAHSQERTVQLGMREDVSYQALIDAMDGLRAHLPDIVLVSPADAQSQLGASGAGGGAR